jgi:long-chain acyl-CoA synthetase
MEHRPWHQHYDYNVPTGMRYPRMPLHNLVRIAAGSVPDKAAIDYLGCTMTFAELRSQVVAMASSLEALGIQKGDRVALQLPNCPQYVISYYAALSLGAIVVNVNPMLTAHELAGIVRDTRPTVLITFDLLAEAAHQVRKAEGLSKVIVTGLGDYAGTPNGAVTNTVELEDGWHQLVTLVHDAPRHRWPRVEIDPADPAAILYTGGTTGVPKGAVLTHANMVAATLQASVWGNPYAHLDSLESRSVLGPIPMFHAYGNICVLNWGMFNCATQILVPRVDIDELVELIDRVDKVSFFPAVPTMLIGILNHPKASTIDLPRKLRSVNSGSAPLATEVIWQLLDLDIFYIEGYGTTESAGLGMANPLMGMSKVGSIGIPYIDTDVRLVDPEEGVHEVGPGEPGELLIKSATVMSHYWNRPEETAQQLRDGWLATGDIAVRDEDWYFSIVDRKKDMIIAGGYNIYPREIDEVLAQHPKILNGIAVGVPDPYRGETVKAFVVLKPGETATPEEIIGFCREQLAAYKAPKLVELRDSLPQSAVGKVLRRMLRDEEA